MLTGAGVAIWSGVASKNLSLIAFGADSMIQHGSAGGLLWRLDDETRRGAEFSELVEHRASRIAEQIGSRSPRADAVESITCGCLSSVVVVGLIVQLLMLDWWWVDSIASLTIVVLLVKRAERLGRLRNLATNHKLPCLDYMGVGSGAEPASSVP